jgi:hypothetical protein
MINIVAICTDHGTEASINDFAGAPVADFLQPWAREVPGIEADAGFVGQIGGGDTTPKHVHLLPRSFLSVGMIHTCMNMTEDVDASLSHFKTWLDQFKAVTHLIHEDHLRQRFVARCFLGTQHSHLESLFKKGVRSAAKWRWGTVLLVLEDLLPLQSALRATCDPQKFSWKEEDKELNASEPSLAAPDSFNAIAVTASIRSSMFWSYSHMLFSFNDIAGRFTAWIEGCDCHGWLQRSQSGNGVELSARARRLKVARTHLGLPLGGVGDGLGFVCPLAGKRAPELARGRHKELVPQMCAESLPQLLLSMTNAGASAYERASILNDFELGKHRMLAVLMQKTLFLGVLPWSLAKHCGPS